MYKRQDVAVDRVSRLREEFHLMGGSMVMVGSVGKQFNPNRIWVKIPER